MEHISGAHKVHAMKVTGTLIKGNIKILTTRAKALSGEFKKSLSYFEGETPPDIKQIGIDLVEAELKLGYWQALQKRFNTTAKGDVPGSDNVTLQEAIYYVGAFSRISKEWQAAAGVEKKERWQSGSRRRTAKTTETVEALDTVTTKDALRYFEFAENSANGLRALIGQLNNTEVEFDDLKSEDITL